MCVCVWGGGGTLIFSYIRRLGSCIVVQNFEFQYFLGFSEKMNIFWGMKILRIYFFLVGRGGGSAQNWRGHLYAF